MNLIDSHGEWVEQVLTTLPFIQWDRFTVFEDPEEPDFKIYGWIDRDDEYKDFVLITLYPLDHSIEYTTSSPVYSEKITEILFGKTGDHIPCIRVEDHFKIPNSVKLESSQSMKQNLIQEKPGRKKCPNCSGNTLTKREIYYLIGSDGYEKHWKCSICGYKDKEEIIL